MGTTETGRSRTERREELHPGAERGEQLRQERAGQGGERRNILEQRERGATKTGRIRTVRRVEEHPGAEREGSN